MKCPKLSAFLKDRASREGLSVRMLAAKIGISGASVQNYIDGTTRPSEEILEKIAAAFGVKLEVLKLQGEQVDVVHGWIYVKGKGDRTRTMPIHPKMRAWLRKAWKPGYLWINKETELPYQDLKKPVKRGAARSGYPPSLLHPHILRDAFGVHALQSGISLRALQLAYGHASIKTTERYLTLTPQHLQDELAQFGRKSSGAMRQRKKP